MSPGVSFFCPAYNDEGNITGTVETTLAVFRKLDLDHEVVVVEDGSPDRTGEVADALAARHPTVRVVHHETNRGYGGALKSGFREARSFPLVTYTDGDNQYDFMEFESLYREWREGFCVIGYRLNRAEGFRRDLQNKVYGFLLRMMFGLRVRDVNCSMKLFPREALDRITIESDSSFLDGEVLLKMRELGLSFIEVPVSHRERLHGEAMGAKRSVIMDTVRDMLAYRRKLRRKRKRRAGG